MVWPNGCWPYSETVSEREVRYERQEFVSFAALLQGCSLALCLLASQVAQ